jgi:hypothetical protein
MVMRADVIDAGLAASAPLGPAIYLTRAGSA